MFLLIISLKVLNEKFTLYDFTLEVIDRSSKRIEKVKVFKKDKKQTTKFLDK